MFKENLLHLNAIILLICVTFIFLVDVGSNWQCELAIKIHYGLVWITVRYISIVAAVLLALDVLFD